MADKYEEQMEMFEDGGLKDEGGTIDPVSGNDVPSGSTQSEVRDDIPAQLSEGEFVLPADVVRYIGLENLMELRNKAKQGLAQMEAMGQMGNSEEATMPDTADMEVDIDAMIDEFDPNDPETLSFADGGVVKAYNGAAMIQGGSAQGMIQPPQQGFQAPVYQAPGVPTGQQLLGGASPVVYGNQEYIGPNNQIINVTTINGNPVQDIPAGYRKYNRAVEGPVSPVIDQPEVLSQPDTGDFSDDRAREEAQQEEYQGFVNTMEDLAELSPEFAKDWENSVHNPKKGFDIGQFMQQGGAFGALKNDYDLNRSAQNAYETIAQEYGLNINDYKNEFTFFGLDKYKESSLVNDAKAAKDISEALGVDPKDLARTDLDRDGDGRVTKDDLVDKQGNLTQEGLDLFNIENEEDDPADTDPADRGPSSPETGPSSGTSPGRPGGESGERGGPSDER